eukprot:TRINITY_DN30296_c0_g2_i1.p1 TRINITY_DN30296_c0_g2~~TRINITY_DN30296_c0_g2_i1.p1  ORF type:complete len:228 (-),score=19.99 TRINITY_DN30296_c0_g2_i1:35-718(-)
MVVRNPFCIGRVQIQSHRKWINYAAQEGLISRNICKVTIGNGIELDFEDVLIGEIERKLEVWKPQDLDAVMDMYISKGQNRLDPYWAVVWPSAQAMAQYIFQNQHLVKGKRVVELGSGLGLGGISAALCDAKEVVLLDREPLALQCSLFNAAQNGIKYVQNPKIFGEVQLPEYFDTQFGEQRFIKQTSGQNNVSKNGVNHIQNADSMSEQTCVVKAEMFDWNNEYRK